MKTMHKSLMIVALTLALSSATNAYAFERGERGGGGYGHEGGMHENFNQPYHHSNYNQEGRAYHSGYNQGMNEGGGGGTTVVQPNSSFEQLEQYGNPNSAANQNMRANQQMQGGQ